MKDKEKNRTLITLIFTDLLLIDWSEISGDQSHQSNQCSIKKSFVCWEFLSLMFIFDL